MNTKEKYKLYDIILDSLFQENNFCLLTSDISEKLNIEFRVAHSLTLDLVELGYIENMGEVAVKSHELRGDFFARLEQKGKFFLIDEGGFNDKYIDLTAKKSWTIAKTAVVIVNAVIILWLSWMTFNESKKSNKLEDEVSKLKKTELYLRQEIIKKDSTISKLKRK